MSCNDSSTKEPSPLTPRVEVSNIPIAAESPFFLSLGILAFNSLINYFGVYLTTHLQCSVAAIQASSKMLTKVGEEGDTKHFE